MPNETSGEEARIRRKSLPGFRVSVCTSAFASASASASAFAVAVAFASAYRVQTAVCPNIRWIIPNQSAPWTIVKPSIHHGIIIPAECRPTSFLDGDQFT